MSKYDEIYGALVKNIIDYGYYSNNRTGMPTYKLPHQIMQFNLQEEFPILTTKFTGWKTALKELLWIMNGNNSVKDLQEQNVHIWDEWEMEDNTIGTSYGWIINKFSVLDDVIYKLRNNPQDRRILINLYQYEYLETGALYPCVFNSCWDVNDNKLNCMLTIRSNDIPLGNPFNVCQYAFLVHMLAQITGHEVGLLTVCISNAHIYENQIEGIKLQLTREGYPAPTLKIDKSVKEFKDFTVDSFELIDYKYHPSIKMPVSI